MLVEANAYLSPNSPEDSILAQTVQKIAYSSKQSRGEHACLNSPVINYTEQQIDRFFGWNTSIMRHKNQTICQVDENRNTNLYILMSFQRYSICFYRPPVHHYLCISSTGIFA